VAGTLEAVAGSEEIRLAQPEDTSGVAELAEAKAEVETVAGMATGMRAGMPAEVMRVWVEVGWAMGAVREAAAEVAALEMEAAKLARGGGGGRTVAAAEPVAAQQV
jgi:hypothetical protein